MSIQNALCGTRSTSPGPTSGRCPAVAGIDLNGDSFLSKFPVLLKKVPKVKARPPEAGKAPPANRFFNPTHENMQA